MLDQSTLKDDSYTSVSQPTNEHDPHVLPTSLDPSLIVKDDEKDVSKNILENDLLQSDLTNNTTSNETFGKEKIESYMKLRNQTLGQSSIKDVTGRDQNNKCDKNNGIDRSLSYQNVLRSGKLFSNL